MLKFLLFQKMWSRRPIQDLPMSGTGEKGAWNCLWKTWTLPTCSRKPQNVGFAWFGLNFRAQVSPVPSLRCRADGDLALKTCSHEAGVPVQPLAVTWPEAAKLDQRMSLFFYMLIGVGAGASPWAWRPRCARKLTGDEQIQIQIVEGVEPQDT